MADPNHAHLRTAFVEPIRFALLLDDQFPVYPCRATEGATAGADYERAAKLFAFCRSKGWLCDVERGVERINQFEHDKHLHQSNLLVLDYHLDPASSEDSSKALSIVQRLAKSPHFNIVIVYTGAEIGAVARDVACALGASGFGEGADLTAVEQAIEDADVDAQNDMEASVNTEMLNAFLRHVAPGQAATALRKVVSGASIPPRNVEAALSVIARRAIEKRVDKAILSARLDLAVVQGRFADGENVLWATREKVFVAIVSKDEEPDVLEDRLLSALAQWDPSPLLIMTVHARAELERAGAIADQSVLDTPLKQAGWLLGVLLASPAAKRATIERLYARLYEKFTRNVAQSAVDFALSVVGETSESEALDRAKLLGRTSEGETASRVYHALNEYLCSDQCPDGPMTTGVIFRAMVGESFKYWLCTSPACDLVPGQNRKGWDSELEPMRPMTAAKLTVNRATSLEKQLNTAAQGRGVYLTIDKESIGLEALDNIRQLRLETIILKDEGLMQNGRFRGFIVSQVEEAPAFIELEFQAIALLRPEYANRLLTDAGQQRSRIGVDFINLNAT